MMSNYSDEQDVAQNRTDSEVVFSRVAGSNNFVSNSKEPITRASAVAKAYRNTLESLNTKLGDAQDAGDLSLATKIEKDLQLFFKQVGDRYDVDIANGDDLLKVIERIESYDEKLEDAKGLVSKYNNEGGFMSKNQKNKKSNSTGEVRDNFPTPPGNHFMDRYKLETDYVKLRELALQNSDFDPVEYANGPALLSAAKAVIKRMADKEGKDYDAKYEEVEQEGALEHKRRLSDDTVVDLDELENSLEG